MNIWIIIFGMAAVTFLPRVLPLVAIDAEALPNVMRRGLNYVPIAVLSTIIGSSYVPSEEWGQFVIDERLIAGVVAIAVAWYTQNIIITITAGMVVLVGLMAILG